MKRYIGVDGIPDFLLPGLSKKRTLLYIGWREVCHVTGSLMLLLFSILIAPIFQADMPLAIGLLLVLWMTYQEFYLHPKKYSQKLGKGILDWTMWVLPFVVYFLFR